MEIKKFVEAQTRARGRFLMKFGSCEQIECVGVRIEDDYIIFKFNARMFITNEVKIGEEISIKISELTGAWAF